MGNTVLANFACFLNSKACSLETLMSGMPTHLVPRANLLHEQGNNWAIRLLAHGKTVFVEVFRNKTESDRDSVLQYSLSRIAPTAAGC